MVFGQKEFSIELLLIVENGKANYLMVFYNFSRLIIRGLKIKKGLAILSAF